MIHIINEQELQGIRDAWDNLMLQDSLASPFQSFQYCQTSIQNGCLGGVKST